jgi:hypothetical protein
MTTDSPAARKVMEDVATLRRAVVLLTEVVRDTVEVLNNHGHDGPGHWPSPSCRSGLNHALGRLDAVASALEQGADNPKPDGSDAGGEGRDNE